MKVLTVARWYPSHDSPGAGSFVSDLVQATVVAGIDVRVVSFDPVNVRVRPDQRERIRAQARAAYAKVATPEALFVTAGSLGASGVLVARLPVVRRPGNSDKDEVIEDYLDALRPFVNELVVSWRPDVIHAHTGLPDGIVAAVIGREHGIPVVVTEHASTIETVLADPLAVERYRTLLEADVLLLAVSPSTAERLSALLDVHHERIGVLSNPVSLEGFPAANGNLREPETLLWVGVLGTHKDIDVLLRSFALLRATRPAVRMELVGGERSAGDRANLEALAVELGIADAVTFLGWQNRSAVAAAMSRATVFVHPSPSETFGVVAAEAILTGLPVATRRSGGVPWIVDRSGGFGAVAENDDPSSFAAAIETVLDGPLAVDAATARCRLARDFGAESIAQKAVEHYDAVIERAHSSAARQPRAPGDPVAPSPDPGDAAAPSIEPPSQYRDSRRFPTVLLAKDRSQAMRHVPHLPPDLRSRLVLVVPRAGHRAAPDGLGDLGVRLVEVERSSAGRGKFLGSRRLARLRRTGDKPVNTKRPFADAVLAIAATVRPDSEAVVVVAIDAAAAALVGRLDSTQVRIAPGGLRWLADCWDVRARSRAVDEAAQPASRTQTNTDPRLHAE